MSEGRIKISRLRKHVKREKILLQNQTNPNINIFNFAISHFIFTNFSITNPIIRTLTHLASCFRPWPRPLTRTPPVSPLCYQRLDPFSRNWPYFYSHQTKESFTRSRLPPLCYRGLDPFYENWRKLPIARSRLPPLCYQQLKLNLTHHTGSPPPITRVYPNQISARKR